MRTFERTGATESLRAVISPDEVRSCNNAFLQCIQNYPGIELVHNCTIGHQGRAFKNVTVIWSEELSLWLYHRQTTQRVVNAYWNAFGCEKPQKTRSLGIAAEINFAFDGSYRRVAGVFYRDESGNLFVGHRGTIREGKRRFWDSYDGERALINSDGKDLEIVAVVGRICEDFPTQVADFVRKVHRLKNPSASGI